VSRFDAVVVGGGHNGLVAAAMLARAGQSVLVLERRDQFGGAAVSGSPWPGVGAYVSRYSYLVSLFPAALRRELGLRIDLRTRMISSYTPVGDSGLLVRGGELDWLPGLAARVAPTLTEPLRTREELRGLLGEADWLLGEPLSGVLKRSFEDDLRRGIVLTDATIGTFAPADDPELRQNRCFLYHVIGDGTGLWKVPVGGIGALTAQLAAAAFRAGVQLRTGAEVTAIDADGAGAELTCADGSRFAARHVLANVAPAVLARMLGDPDDGEEPEGSQLKINMLVRRLPRLRDPDVAPEEAFAGTFHVNESYTQLGLAYGQAAAGQIPSLPPCELYCHSRTDPTILSDELRAASAQTLTLFGLHMPARLFREAPDEAKHAAVEATLASVNSVLAEPIEDCLWTDSEGAPCLEALTPVELEAELGMPGGHIFHRDLAWPFAESEAEVGRWGVETERANVWLCGAGARRGGGVSGIPGHNAARAVLAVLAPRTVGDT
jgi:phytoene dehydrogenase-like protein